jgi:hypothetical protein
VSPVFVAQLMSWLPWVGAAVFTVASLVGPGGYL